MPPAEVLAKDSLELHDLRLGKSRVALRAAQGREDAAIELLARDGDVEIVVHR